MLNAVVDAEAQAWRHSCPAYVANYCFGYMPNPPHENASASGRYGHNPDFYRPPPQQMLRDQLGVVLGEFEAALNELPSYHLSSSDSSAAAAASTPTRPLPRQSGPGHFSVELEPDNTVWQPKASEGQQLPSVCLLQRGERGVDEPATDALRVLLRRVAFRIATCHRTLCEPLDPNALPGGREYSDRDPLWTCSLHDVSFVKKLTLQTLLAYWLLCCFEHGTQSPTNVAEMRRAACGIVAAIARTKPAEFAFSPLPYLYVKASVLTERKGCWTRGAGTSMIEGLSLTTALVQCAAFDSAASLIASAAEDTSSAEVVSAALACSATITDSSRGHASHTRVVSGLNAAHIALRAARWAGSNVSTQDAGLRQLLDAMFATLGVDAASALLRARSARLSDESYSGKGNPCGDGVDDGLSPFLLAYRSGGYYDRSSLADVAAAAHSALADHGCGPLMRDAADCQFRHSPQDDDDYGYRPRDQGSRNTTETFQPSLALLQADLALAPMPLALPGGADELLRRLAMLSTEPTAEMIRMCCAVHPLERSGRRGDLRALLRDGPAPGATWERVRDCDHSDRGKGVSDQVLDDADAVVCSVRITEPPSDADDAARDAYRQAWASWFAEFVFYATVSAAAEGGNEPIDVPDETAWEAAGDLVQRVRGRPLADELDAAVARKEVPAFWREVADVAAAHGVQTLSPAHLKDLLTSNSSNLEDLPERTREPLYECHLCARPAVVWSGDAPADALMAIARVAVLRVHFALGFRAGPQRVSPLGGLPWDVVSHIAQFAVSDMPARMAPLWHKLDTAVSRGPGVGALVRVAAVPASPA